MKGLLLISPVSALMDNHADSSSALTAIMASIRILPAQYHFSILIYVNKILSKSMGHQIPYLCNNRCHFGKTGWFKHDETRFVASSTRSVDRPNVPKQIESTHFHDPYHVSSTFSQRHHQKEAPAPQLSKEEIHRPHNSSGTVPFAPAQHTRPVIKNINPSSLKEEPHEQTGSRSETINVGSQESTGEWIIAKKNHPRKNTEPDHLNNTLEGEKKACRDCSAMFVIGDDTIRWFLDRGLNTLARCQGCRDFCKQHTTKANAVQPLSILQTSITSRHRVDGISYASLVSSPETKGMIHAPVRESDRSHKHKNTDNLAMDILQENDHEANDTHADSAANEETQALNEDQNEAVEHANRDSTSNNSYIDPYELSNDPEHANTHDSDDPWGVEQKSERIH